MPTVNSCVLQGKEREGEAGGMDWDVNKEIYWYGGMGD
jgi:hypothetical protein